MFEQCFLNSVIGPAREVASILGCLIVSHKLVDKLGHKGFVCLMVLVVWLFWKDRNRESFEGVLCTSITLALKVKDKARMWVKKGTIG